MTKKLRIVGLLLMVFSFLAGGVGGVEIDEALPYYTPFSVSSGLYTDQYSLMLFPFSETLDMGVFALSDDGGIYHMMIETIPRSFRWGVAMELKPDLDLFMDLDGSWLYE